MRVKIFILFVLTVIISSCSTLRTFYIPREFPKEGKLLKVEENCDSNYRKAVFDNDLIRFIYFHNDSKIETFYIYKEDTVNRTYDENKVGKWFKLIKKYNLLVEDYYFDNKIIASIGKFWGEKIKIDILSDSIVLNSGDILASCCLDSVICIDKLSISNKMNINKLMYYNKNNIRSIDYNNQKNISSYCIFYKKNRLAATFNIINNEYQVDSLYNKKGELIYWYNHKNKESKQMGTKYELKKCNSIIYKDWTKFFFPFAVCE